MSGATITALIAALAALIGSVGTLIKLHFDRKAGVRGDMLKNQEIEINKHDTAFSIQTVLLKNVMDVNTDLTERLDRMEEREKERDAKLLEQERRISRYAAKIQHLERVILVRVTREEILLDHISKGLGPPPPDLPALPLDPLEN